MHLTLTTIALIPLLPFSQKQEKGEINRTPALSQMLVPRVRGGRYDLLTLSFSNANCFYRCRMQGRREG